MLIGHIDHAEKQNRHRPRQHEQHPGDDAATHPMQQPSQIDGELLRLRPRQQHAEIQRMQKPLLADPFQLIDKKPVHHCDLSGRPAKAEKADFQPDIERLVKTDAGVPVHAFIC